MNFSQPGCPTNKSKYQYLSNNLLNNHCKRQVA